jgi:hypothetical protein
MAARRPLQPLVANIFNPTLPPQEHVPITHSDVAARLMYTPELRKRKRQHPLSVSDQELVDAKVNSQQVRMD